MKSPPGGAGVSRVDGNRIAARNCPWPCLYAHKHEQLTDTSGHVRGTLCHTCGQFLSRSDWRAAFNDLPEAGAPTL